MTLFVFNLVMEQNLWRTSLKIKKKTRLIQPHEIKVEPQS